jgi:hypothetical protein
MPRMRAGMARYTGAFVQDCLSGFRRPSLPHRTAREAVEKRFLALKAREALGLAARAEAAGAFSGPRARGRRPATRRTRSSTTACE